MNYTKPNYFHKGHIPFNKGKKGFLNHTKETKEKIRKASIGRKPRLGMKNSIESNLKRSDSAKNSGVGKWMKGRRSNHWTGGQCIQYLKTKEKIAGRKKPEVCEICGGGGRICFDHDHATGNFRGWICHRCNATLGFVKDNSELLIALSDYLKKSR